MRIKIAILLFLIFSNSSCTQKCPPPATDPLIAASIFLDACLKGDFKKASCYMQQDSTNIRLLNEVKKDYDTKSSLQKKEYSAASIQIENDEVIADGIHIIYYRNSYDKTARKIKVLQLDDKWISDFSYTFNGNL